MSDTAIYKQNTTSIACELDGEYVLMNSQTGDCFGLGEVESRIWKAIETPVAIADVCEKMCQIYDVSVKDCEAQVAEFIESLATQGFVDKE